MVVACRPPLFIFSVMTKISNEFIESLVAVALGQVGKREVGHNGGAAVRAYQSATSLDPGDWPWCAAFVCWCFLTASVRHPLGRVLPVSARAFDFEGWGRRNATLYHAPESIRKGDVVIYEFSHIGIASCDSVGGWVDVVEGNTNPAGSREGDGVYHRTRPLHLVRSVVHLGS